MPDFNIDDALSSFEPSKAKSKPQSKDFDIDSVLSEFGGKKDEAPKAAAISIHPVAPPISGDNGPLPQPETTIQGGENPRSLLPQTNIQESAYNADQAGKDLVSSGVEDFQTGHPYKAAAKVVGGSLARLASPMTGIVQGGVVTPITDITGNPEIGSRAGDVVGSALPIVPGVGAIVRAIPKNKALSTLVDSIGPAALHSVVKSMKDNPRLNPADLSPKVLQDTQHLFTQDGPHINYLANTSADRMAGAKGAIKDAYDTSGGVSVDLAKKIDDLAAASKKVGNEKINPAVAGAGTVDVSPVIAHIDKVLKPGVMSKVTEESTLALPEVKATLARARELLTNGTETRTGAQDLHDIQKSLRRQSYNLMKSGNAGEREVGKSLLGVRNQIVEAIDKASPQVNGKGTYKPALDSYRDEMHIADAFKKGHDDIFSGSKNMENDPSFTRKWFDGLTDSEKQAAKEGARTAIHTEMGVAKNPALAGEKFSRSDFNKEKLEILFGKAETDSLLTKLEHERTIANTHNKVIEGSQTAMRSASKAQFSLPTKTEVGKGLSTAAIMETGNVMAGGIGGIGTALYGGLRVANAAKDKVKLALAKEHNAAYAKLALPSQGPDRDALIKALEDRIPGPKKSMLARASSSRLARLVGP